MSEYEPKGRDADFDWCLAFGEGARTMPVSAEEAAEEPEKTGVDLQLPNVAAQVWIWSLFALNFAHLSLHFSLPACSRFAALRAAVAERRLHQRTRGARALHLEAGVRLGTRGVAAAGRVGVAAVERAQR